jgi:hypothetical protein
MTTTATGLMLPETITGPSIFDGDNIRKVIAFVVDKAEAEANGVDISTKAGEEVIRSLAYKIARSKTFIDDLGKDLNAGLKKQAKIIDDQRSLVRTALDDLKDKIRKPLTEKEEREKARKEAIQSHLARMKAWGESYPDLSSHETISEWRYRGVSFITESLKTVSFDEFSEEALLVQKTSLQKMAETFDQATKRVEEKEEFERLKREEQARKEQLAKEEYARKQVEIALEKERAAQQKAAIVDSALLPVKAPVSPTVEEKKSQYTIIDEIITEMFGKPDPALGGFVLDHGNLQAFAARVLETLKDQKQTTGCTVTKVACHD